MNICFITDNSETNRHPVIGSVLRQLSATHTVRLLDVQTRRGEEAIAQEGVCRLADVYLLKSHSSQALTLAHHLERRGAKVINSWASSRICQDRELMSRRMTAAHLPWPRTWSFLPSETTPQQQGFLATLPFPLMIKSRYSYRGDLVARVRSVEQLQTLALQRQHETFVLQEFVHGDGSDIKLWIIDQQIFAARRGSPLEPDACQRAFPIHAARVPNAWKAIALRIGRVFRLSLYGIDLLMTKRGSFVVDVNSFPGFRDVAGADCALVRLIQRAVS